MNKTLEEALNEIVYEARYKRKQNVRRLTKIHKLKQENRILSARRKTLMNKGIHYKDSSLRILYVINLEQLNKWSEQIGKNSAKIQRLRTLISQNK